MQRVFSKNISKSSLFFFSGASMLFSTVFVSVFCSFLFFIPAVFNEKFLKSINSCNKRLSAERRREGIHNSSQWFFHVALFCPNKIMIGGRRSFEKGAKKLGTLFKERVEISNKQTVDWFFVLPRLQMFAFGLVNHIRKWVEKE